MAQLAKKNLTITPLANDILEKVSTLEEKSQSEIISELLMCPRMALLYEFAKNPESTEPVWFVIEYYQQKQGGPMTMEKSRAILEFLDDALFQMDFDEDELKKNNGYFSSNFQAALGGNSRALAAFQELISAADSRTLVSKSQVQALVDTIHANLDLHCVYGSPFLFRNLVVAIRCSKWCLGYNSEEFYPKIRELIFELFC